MRANLFVIMDSHDFFRILFECGVCKSKVEYLNLKEFLAINKKHTNLILLKRIKMTLEKMNQNKDIMKEIEDEILEGESVAR